MSRETTIRQTHAALTLEALEALANKGLVRRAQKDLERGEVTGFETTDSSLIASVSGHRVTLIEAGPAKATCTCPAPGVCQHIIAACLKLMQEPSAEPTGDAQAEWLALREEEIMAAYGLPVLRAAHELTLANVAQIESSSVLTIRFPSLNAEVMTVPGAGLTGIIVRGLTEKKHTQLAAAAVLVVRRQAGMDWQPPASDVSRSAPIHRDEVIKATIALLEEAIATGLARLSPSLVERFDALSISAQTAELHRLGLVLQRIATQATDWLQRRPHADLGLIFAEMATAYALAHAKPQLAAGVARESYIEVGALDLIGVAAWPWRTPSGYEGLSLLFWDPSNATWNTWSDARPRAFAGGFSAIARYTQPGPWEGAESPAQLARSRFRLMQAKRNRWGRLSSSAQAKALVTGAADLSELPCCDAWSKLDLKPSLGLRENDPRTAYRVLAPSSWVRQPFDPVTQTLSWILLDAQKSAIELRIAYDELTKPVLEQLENLAEQDLDGVRIVGRVFNQGGRLVVHPLTLLKQGKQCPLFWNSNQTVKPSSLPAGSVMQDRDIDDLAAEADDSTSPRLDATLLDCLSSLEWLAESGIRSQCPEALKKLDELAGRLSFVGPLASSLKSCSQQTQRPKGLLRLRWYLKLLQKSST